MRIASFNVENLIFRHKRLLPERMDREEALAGEMDRLMTKVNKSVGDWERMRRIWAIINWDTDAPRDEHKDLEWHELIARSGAGDKRRLNQLIIQTGLNANLFRLNPESIKNKARMINETDADILVLQEVESRECMTAFNELFLDNLYNNAVFIPSMDGFARGMGIFCRDDNKVLEIRSIDNAFVSNKDLTNLVHYYRIHSKKGPFDILNVNLTRKDVWNTDGEGLNSFFDQIISWTKLQMNRTAYRMVVGSFNHPPHSDLMEKILSDLRLTTSNQLDCFSAPLDRGTGAHYHGLGTYGVGKNLLQYNYILLDKLTALKTISAGMNRKGVVPMEPGQWETYDDLNNRNKATNNPVLSINLV